MKRPLLIAAIGAIILFIAIPIGKHVDTKIPTSAPLTSAPPLSTPATSLPALSLPVARIASTNPGTYRESFDRLTFRKPPVWQDDTPDRTSRFADNGEYFYERDPSFAFPQGYRISAPFGQDGFLTIESYSQTKKDPKELFDIVTDPVDPTNRVLRIASPEHTDGTIIRTTKPLGTRYEVCARIGSINFGTGDGLNGYQGGESSTPWLGGPAVYENGFYFGGIVRSAPAPHNNVLLHHERIFFIDSDNNLEGWTSIWDPETRSFIRSGWHPIVMGAVDAQHAASDENGPPVWTFAGGAWNRPGDLLAADAYKEQTWYTACFIRRDDRFTMRISGDFRMGGKTTYEALLTDTSGIYQYQAPHFWFLGDPHINYYEGSLLVDDVTVHIDPAR